jgi:hypothetical protein
MFAQKIYELPKEVEYVFVADMFAEHYSGGAELTLDAIMEKCPGKFFKIRSQLVTEDLIEQGKDKKWILGNFTGMSKDLLTLIATTLNYSIIECDYKYCLYRSSHLHKLQTGKECDCHKTDVGRFIKGLFKRAQSVHFMSNGQMNVYKKLFPHMSSWAEGKLVVQGSTFTTSTLEKLKNLSEKYQVKNGKYFIQGGGTTSWIKNTQGCVQYCEKNKILYDVVGGLKPEEFLKILAQYQGIIFFPLGYDTNPRITIEAKLLSLDLILNDNVQQKNDDWFNLPENELLDYLHELPNKFWRNVK